VLATASGTQLRDLVVRELTAVLGPDLDRTLHTDRHEGRPGVVLVVGVNGAGKTTTVGKIARVLVGDGKSVVLGAADTFRAAAADQLETWGQRVGAQVVRSDREGADPASVAFETVQEGISERTDTVIVDTAGRLHTKTGLMDELGKIKRVIERQATVDEVLLVLDATTGQNAINQVQIFQEIAGVTSLVVTKLDGTARGGILVAIAERFKLPINAVGIGEGLDDLEPFDAQDFARAIAGARRKNEAAA